MFAFKLEFLQTVARDDKMQPNMQPNKQYVIRDRSTDTLVRRDLRRIELGNPNTVDLAGQDIHYTSIN